jgi:outer membrane immunogenic protein
MGDAMRRILLAGATLLALTAAQPAVAQPMPVFNWSGLYIGGHVGGAWLDANYLSNHATGAGPCFGSGFVTPCDPVNHRAANFIGGGQLGLRWQQGQWVLGVEGSLAATRLQDTTASVSLPDELNYTSDLRSIFTATVQAGYAWDRALWYVKGGYAGGRLHFDSFATGGATGPVSTWVNGWTVGTGLEYALIGNLSVGVEYDYIRLTGDASTCSPNAGNVFSCPVPPGLVLRYASYTANIHQVLVRLNYKFGL